MDLLKIFRSIPEKRNVSYVAPGAGSLLFNGYNSYQPNQAMLHSAVYRCVDLISNSIALLPIHVHVLSDGYKIEDTAHPVYRLFAKRPNNRMTRFTFFKLMVANLLLSGNAYAIIRRNSNHVITELQYVPSHCVSVQQSTLFQPVKYIIAGVGSFNPEDIIHVINHPSADGVVGLSTIHYAAKTLKLGFAELDTALQYFNSGANKAGIIKCDKPITDEQELQILGRWNNTFKGSQGQPNGVVVLKPGMEYQPIQMSALDALLLESRKFTVIDIARFFGVSPSKLFDQTNQSYSTLEQSNLDFLVTTLAPLIEKIECELNSKLWLPVELEYELRFDTSVLLRTDKEALTKYFNSLFNMGVLSPNEIRRQLDLSPVEGGDIHVMLVNLATIDSIGKTAAVDNEHAPNQIKGDDTDDIQD